MPFRVFRFIENLRFMIKRVRSLKYEARNMRYEIESFYWKSNTLINQLLG